MSQSSFSNIFYEDETVRFQNVFNEGMFDDV